LLIYSLYICYSKSDLSQVRNGKPLRFVFWGSLRPSADWVWDWVALGWPKRGAREAQASIQESALLATKAEKRLGWGGKSPGSPGSPKSKKEKLTGGLRQMD
jgi:hypothetical protein